MIKPYSQEYMLSGKGCIGSRGQRGSGTAGLSIELLRPEYHCIIDQYILGGTREYMGPDTE